MPVILSKKSRVEHLEELKVEPAKPLNRRSVGFRQPVVPTGLVTFLKNGTKAEVEYGDSRYVAVLDPVSGYYVPSTDIGVVFNLRQTSLTA